MKSPLDNRIAFFTALLFSGVLVSALVFILRERVDHRIQRDTPTFTPSETEKLIDFPQALVGAPKVDQRGERALFVFEEHGAKQLALWEQGLGTFSLEIDGAKLVGEPTLSRDGSRALFFVTKSSGATSLASWQSGTNSEILLDQVFTGPWSVGLSGSGMRAILAPQGPSATFSGELQGEPYSDGGVLLLSFLSTAEIQLRNEPPKNSPSFSLALLEVHPGNDILALNYPDLYTIHGKPSPNARASLKRERIEQHRAPLDIDGDGASDLLVFKRLLEAPSLARLFNDWL